jgi:hypothetical protein
MLSNTVENLHTTKPVAGRRMIQTIEGKNYCPRRGLALLLLFLVILTRNIWTWHIRPQVSENWASRPLCHT